MLAIYGIDLCSFGGRGGSIVTVLQGKKKSRPVNRDRFITKMFMRGDNVILVGSVCQSAEMDVYMQMSVCAAQLVAYPYCRCCETLIWVNSLVMSVLVIEEAICRSYELVL